MARSSIVISHLTPFSNPSPSPSPFPGGRAFIVYPLREATGTRGGGGDGESDMRNAQEEFDELQRSQVFGEDK